MPKVERPRRRKLQYQTVEEFLADVRHLHAAGYTRAGTWSLGTMSEHIAKTIDGSIDGFDVKAPWAIRIVGPLVGWLTLKFKWIPSGVPMPEAIVPNDAVSDDDGVAHLERSVARLQATTQFHDSPLFGKGSAQKWPTHHLIHASHHFSFLIPKS